ncbi:MAG: hypothetical protein KGJ93_04205, partial [Patescibacteria group bacterium]|nr:hypothetical protein [Patescibacteria group bacterium]
MNYLKDNRFAAIRQPFLWLMIFALVTNALYWPVKPAQAATALTMYFTNTNDTLLTSGRQLTNSSPASETNVTVKVGTASGWGILSSQGSTASWPAAASEPAQNGVGFIWDVTTLEGQQILSGNWTPKVKLSVSFGSIVADIHARVSVYHSGGTYSTILDASSTGQTINTTATVYTLPATSGALTNFSTGDKLYEDVILNITTNSTGKANAVINVYQNNGANESLVTPGYQAQPTTTLADGTNPGNVTIAPGGSITDLDAFTLATNTGTDTITAMTVTLSTSSGISQVDVTNTSNVAQCTAVANPSSTTANFTGCSLAVTTSPTTFKIRITPLSATSMPAPPGGTYTITGTVTALIGTNTDTGTDTGSATVTIDNQSPAEVTSPSATGNSGNITLSWTNPADTDFNSVIILRSTSTVTATPTEGTLYSAGNTIGAATVVAIASSSPYADSTVSGGVTYYYKIFTYDNYLNYSASGSANMSASSISTTISGVAYTDDTGGTGVNTKTIKVLINGTSTTTVTTDTSGNWTATPAGSWTTGDIITAYISGDATKGMVIDRASSSSLTNLKIYGSTVRLMSDDNATVTTANLATANSNVGSADQMYTVSGNDLTVTAGYKLRVASGKAYAPIGNVTASALELNGTYNAGSGTTTLTGAGTGATCTGAVGTVMPLCVSGGSFTASTSKISFAATTGTTTVPDLNYYNLDFSPASGTPVYQFSATGSPVQMSTASTSPGSAGVDNTLAGTAWDSSGNILAADGVYASTTLLSSANTNYLKATNFGFNIPSSATVNGIVVEVLKYADSVKWRVNDFAARMVQSGVIGTTDRSSPLVWSTTTPPTAYVSYGSSTDTWGSVWTPSDINSSTTGFALAAINNSLSGIGYVDHIRMAVFYSIAGSSTVAVSNNLTLGGLGNAKLDAYTNNTAVTVSGNMVIGSGDTYSAAGSATTTITGNFTNNGTFTANSGTVLFTPTATSTIAASSSMSFYNLTITSAAKELDFQGTYASSPVYTVAGTFTASGSPGSLINIRSATAGVHWLVHFNIAQSSIKYVFLKDSGCDGGSAIADVSDGTVSDG